MKKYLIVLCAAVAAFAGCTKTTPEPGTAREVKFTVSNLGVYQFKSPTVALGTDGCGQVGIYALDLGANNVAATVSGTTLVPSTPIYWNVGQADDATTQFAARYPHADGALVSGEYGLPADQSSEDAFTYHANVVTAVATGSPVPGTVSFDFKHPFAKVAVVVTNNLTADAVKSVVLKQVKLNASEMDITEAPAKLTLADDLADVTAYAVSATRYEMVIMPQAATSAMDIVVTTNLNSVYTFRISGSYTFVAGKVAVANVTLDPIGGSTGGRNAVGAVSIETVEEWSDGVATTVDTIGEPVLGDYYQIGGCVYTLADKGNAAWAKYYNMSYTAENTWEITLNYDEAMTDDESGKGFIIRVGGDTGNYFGMWTGSEYIPASDYTLEPTDEDHKNIKLPSSGKYTVTYNSSTRKIAYVRNGDAE